MRGGVIVALAVLVGSGIVATKVVSNKLKEKAANIDFGFGFNRIHGLIGDGISKFLSPTVRIIFNLQLKNFSGINLEAKKIYTRIEAQKPGQKDWTVVATQTGYQNIAIKDGENKTFPVSMDVKGFASISSLTNRKNRHRAVVSYEFKGIAGTYTSDIDIASKLGAFYDQQKKKFPALSGSDQPHTLCLAF